MSHNTIQVPSDDYDRFVDAARAAAKPELGKLVQATIAALREMDAVGMFGDVAARHLWDEYCWQLQEGPYDDDDMGFGSTSSNFEQVLDTVIAEALDALPRHALLFLSIYTRDDIGNDPDSIGSISRDAIASAVLERVNQIASRRNLDFIGPDRGNVIPMEISLAGLAGEALSDAGESSDFLSEYVSNCWRAMPTTLPMSAMHCWSATWNCCAKMKTACCCPPCMTDSRTTSERWCWKRIFAQQWRTRWGSCSAHWMRNPDTRQCTPTMKAYDSRISLTTTVQLGMQ